MVTDISTSRPSFPEDWAAGVGSGPPFTFDAMHFPFPLSPLFASLRNSDGFLTALREYKVPVLAMDLLFRNHYRFSRLVMREPRDEAEAVQLFQPAEDAIRFEAVRLLERWQGEHFPRVLELLARIDQMNPTIDEMGESVVDIEAITTELWTIHFRIVIPMTFAMQEFDELYADLFGEAGTDAHAVLVGVLSESVKAGIGLSDLAQMASELGLAGIMRDSAPDALLANLAKTPDGPAFLARLNAYLAVYGYRQDLYDYFTPTWIEDPTFALFAIRTYIQSGRDLRKDHEAMVRSAEVALQADRTRLAGYPEPVRQQFEATLQCARQGAFLQEEHNFYIDQQATAKTRHLFLRIGRRLVDAGLIDHPDDIVLLTTQELGELATDRDSSELPSRLRQDIESRRWEMAVARQVSPPPYLGSTPPQPPRYSNTMARGMARFWGTTPPPSGNSAELRGMAGSKGTVTGIARVARTLPEASSLRPGEILVAITTMPPWTPLFAIAAAVVTESGGPLSHCAIVAREYGIPAVVAVPDATNRIVTGQRITVDGTSGVVTIAS